MYAALMIHLFSDSLFPTRSAMRPRVSLIASFGSLGNLQCASQSNSRGSRRTSTHCFFKTSTKPVLVRSLPETTFLKASKMSTPIRRFGALEGLPGIDVSVPTTDNFGTCKVGVDFKLFERLILVSGMRGGSIGV